MDQDTQATSNPDDTQAAGTQVQPWVKPAVERIPLSEATAAPTNLNPIDGGQGSIS